MTHAEKLEKFRNGFWRVEQPKVDVTSWSDNDWIIYIDNMGGWFK